MYDIVYDRKAVYIMKKENTAIRLKRIMSDRNLRQVDILNLTEPYCKKYDVKMLLRIYSGKTRKTA